MPDDEYYHSLRLTLHISPLGVWGQVKVQPEIQYHRQRESELDKSCVCHPLYTAELLLLH